MICDTCADKNYCEPHRKNGELIVMCGAYKKLPTNADGLRAMNDEELADYHAKMQLLGEYGVDSEKTELCKKLWLDWLQSPVGGDDHG